jgi:hypothetical protein
MQVTKLRGANDNGLVPAGRTFARLAEGLRRANERAAAILDVYEEHERRLERRYTVKRRDTIPAARAPLEHAVFGTH